MQEFYGKKWQEYEQRFGSSPSLAFFISCVKKFRGRQISSRYAPIVSQKSVRAVRMTESNSRELSKIDKVSTESSTIQIDPVQNVDLRNLAHNNNVFKNQTT